jgi:hypothetical protein
VPGRIGTARHKSRNSEVTVALQGTLDTFALPDVLRLLASTKKTGRLRVSGNRGTGSVWVDAGGVTATEAAGLTESPSPVEVLFELLRYNEGSFTFETGTTPANPNSPRDVEPLLIEAEHLLIEWREIEAVVPSMDARVTLALELPRSDVVIEKERWKTIVTIGSGTTVATIGRTLGLGEVAVCRVVKDLVELGLGEVSAAPPASSTDAQVVEMKSTTVADPEPEPVGEADGSIDLDDLATTDNGASDEAPSDLGRFEIEIPGVDNVVPVISEPAVPAAAASNGHAAVPAPETTMEDPAEADEVARQLASLSPKAARAVAAAARAETDEEREAALAEVTGDDDEPINRGLLLKFLSSVRS